MSKKLKILLIALVLLLPLPILALEIHNNDNVTLGTDKVIDGNYYAAGQNIEIYGTVNGDLFLAGNMITIDSENINGNIFIFSSWTNPLVSFLKPGRDCLLLQAMLRCQVILFLPNVEQR